MSSTGNERDWGSPNSTFGKASVLATEGHRRPQRTRTWAIMYEETASETPDAAAQAYAGSRDHMPLAKLRPAPGTGVSTSPSPGGSVQGWRLMRVTCEPGEAGNALRNGEPLKISGELHLHDAGHALKYHPGQRRQLLSEPPPRSGRAAAPARKALSLGFSVWKIMSSVHRDNFTSSFLIWVFYFLFLPNCSDKDF